MSEGNFDSTSYWQSRYASGGNSGAGSFGRLAIYKAHFLNQFAVLNGVGSVMDFGCGDGNQLALFRLTRYVGLDVSDVALSRCRQKYADRPGYSFQNIGSLQDAARCDATISMDVIYHLTEDTKFEQYIQNLFTMARKFCIIYASNSEWKWSATHVRHRPFTKFIAQSMPHWRLAGHIPNPYPFQASDPDNTSFADFFIYAAEGLDCVIPSPGPK